MMPDTVTPCPSPCRSEPIMVWVLPAPVAPYANTVVLYPSKTAGICGLAVRSNTCACVASASKAASKAYSLEEPCWLRR